MPASSHRARIPPCVSSRCPVEASQSATPDSGDAVASTRPSGEYATQTIDQSLLVVPIKVRMFSPDETSHTFAVPSVQAEARVRPSGENTTQLTCRLLPSKTARRLSVATSQSAML